MAQPSNGRRRKKDAEAPDPRGFTVNFAPDLFDRAKRYKTEQEIKEGRKVPWTEIVSAALEDYLKKKGA